MQQVKVVYPKAYDARTGFIGKPFVYLTDNTIDEVAKRVCADLFQVHDSLEKHAGLNGMVVDVTDISDQHEPLQVTIDIYVPHDDVDRMLNNQLLLKSIVEIWAQRSRVRGMRGDRFYAIEYPDPNSAHNFTIIDPSTDSPMPMTNLDGTSRWDFEQDIVLRTNLLLGTTVFYNEHRATIGFPSTEDEGALSLENLAYHLSKEFDEIKFNVKMNDARFFYGM